jgi:hypothetical protein
MTITVTRKQQRIINERLAARLVGYGTNGAPNPPYIDYDAV